MWNPLPGVTDFRRKKNDSDAFYDPEFDAALIEQSIAKQYNILPSVQGDLSYTDWVKLVSGLMDDTPIGRTIEIRLEKDPEIIKSMSRSQLNIRSEWDAFRLDQIICDPASIEDEQAQLEQMIAGMFS